MKKRLLWILMPVFAFAFVLALASCSNAYSGNYTEVTDKTELNAVEQKISNAATEAENAGKNYELVISASVTTEFGGEKSTVSYTANMLEDVTNKISYAKITLSANVSGTEAGTMNGTVEYWNNQNTDGFSYVNYDIKGTGAAKDYSQSGKVKGKNTLAINEVTESLSMFTSGVTTSLDLQDAVDALEAAGAKVYQDGNKIKVEYEYNKMKTTIYIVLNEDHTYQMKMEVPNAVMELIGMKMTMSENMELKPTTKTVSLPNDSEYTEE